MKIGIIGAGTIGSTVAQHFVDAGHEVAISNSRGPESLQELAQELGPNAHAATVTDAAAFGDIVLEAIPFGEYETLPAEELAGKTVISASNYHPERDGDVDLDGRTQTEAIADHLADSRVLKAFNTMQAETLRDGARLDEPVEDRLVLYLAGDDALAKANVAELIEEIGFAAVDVGSLAHGELMEPGSRIYDNPMTQTEAEALFAQRKH